MRTKVYRIANISSSVVLLAALGACGGGGGSPTATQPVPTPTPTPPPVNTTPQTSTYSSGSGEKAVFEQLNAERGRCGFGFLKQNAQLDLATADAIAYAKLRSAEGYASELAFGHTEDPSKSGFTGVQPYDRAAYRGFNALPVYESLHAHRQYTPITTTKDFTASKSLAVLMTTVYHLREQVSTVTDVGIAHGEMLSLDNVYTSRLQMLFATPTGSTWQAPMGVLTYPCDGTTAAAGAFTPSSESPNPAPDLGAISVGTPIYVRGPANTALTSLAASVKLAAGGSDVPIRILTSANDPQAMLYINDAFILPLQPLQAGQTYAVFITGISDGQAFSKTFSFTPAATVSW